MRPQGWKDDAGRLYAMIRVCAGIGLLLAPGFGARLLGRPGARALSRLLGLRDIALGAAALTTEPSSSAWRRAIALGAAADLFDAALRLCTTRDGARLPVVATALAGAAAGGYLASHPSMARDVTSP